MFTDRGAVKALFAWTATRPFILHPPDAPGMDGVRVLLPRSLQEYWPVAGEVLAQAGTLAEALGGLSARHPGLTERILDDQGRVRRHVHVFVNGASVAGKDPGSVVVRAGDTVHVLPAVSGG